MIPQIPLGLVLGLLLLEGVIRLNTNFLLKGIAPPTAMDAAVQTLDYSVRYSDGDQFQWAKTLVRPLPPGGDAVEANVHFQTDEFGFPNPAPLPPTVDLVVLGRSYSMGAQANDPWPRQYMAYTHRTILNLSEQGNNIDTKIDFFNRFGLARNPHWLIVEILPIQDILTYEVPDPLLLERMAYPLTESLFSKIIDTAPVTPIYPMIAQVNTHTVPLVIYPADFQALTINGTTIGKSLVWQEFSGKLLGLVNEAAAHHICTALLYAATKAEIYVPLVENTEVLAPALSGMPVWQIDSLGNLYPTTDVRADAKMMQGMTNTAHTLVAGFASDHHLPFIDPTDAMRKSALDGQDPFLTYDTHWSAIGQNIVAREVEAALPTTTLDSADCKP